MAEQLAAACAPGQKARGAASDHPGPGAKKADELQPSSAGLPFGLFRRKRSWRAPAEDFCGHRDQTSAFEMRAKLDVRYREPIRRRRGVGHDFCLRIIEKKL